MINWFKRGTLSDGMSIAQARKYVYAFGDLLAQGAPLIGDASTLPCPRDKLRQAFQVYLAWMNAERSKDSINFEKEGYGETLRAAESCFARLSDFHDIAPEDKAAVERANRNPSSFISDEGIELLGKYPPGQSEK